jgi:nocturnin
VPPEVLEWDYRFQLVMAEVAESSADIICIQELNHYDQLLSQLRPLGYEGTFLPKNCSPAAR